MPDDVPLIRGEAVRTLDERFRVSLPLDMSAPLTDPSEPCRLAKERPGCLSLWNPATWRSCYEPRLDVVRAKLRAGDYHTRWHELQHLGRLLSTRDVEVAIAGRGRIVVPEGFRDFLAVERGDPVVIIGAAVCVELWNPTHWKDFLGAAMAEFPELLDRLGRR